MYKAFIRVNLVAILFVLAGCVTAGRVGKDFIRPSSDLFQLGQTSYSQVASQLGEPEQAGEIQKNDKVIKKITYLYVNAVGEPLEEDAIPARTLNYYFYHDKLVGQSFSSSFKSDNSNFDNTKIENIKKGKTSLAEVIQMVGKPASSFVYPMVKSTSRETIGYTYAATRKVKSGGYKSFQKSMQISFDDKDIVSDVNYSSSENSDK